MPVKPIPEGHNTVSPYLVVNDANGEIDFLKKAFDAVELHRTADPSGRIMHAEVRIGDTVVMLGQANEHFKPMPTNLNVYVIDCDATYNKATAAGAKSIREPATQFYGDRSAGVEDLNGNMWWLSTHVEDVSEEEILRRMKAAAH